MRRLIAFISLAVTMIVIAVLGVPTLRNDIKAGTEFDGGYDIFYQVTNSDGVSYQGNALKTVMGKATKTVNKRLNSLDISYPQVSIENDEYIRVTVPAANEYELELIRHTISSNGEISIRDYNDKLLAKGEDIFKSVSLFYSEGQAYMTVKISDYELMKEITHEQIDEPAGDTPMIVFWLGFEEAYTESIKEETGFSGDSYANIEANTYSQWKLLSAVSLDSVIEEDFVVQGAFSEDNMAVLNSILSTDPVSFVLNEEYHAPHGSLLGEKGPRLAIIAAGIGLLVIAILMIVAYHFAGIISILSIALYSIVVIVAYNLIGGLFGTETIAAMAIGIGLAVDANVILIERVKDEIRKGKSIVRSFNEGSKKSVSTILDANVLVIVAAFALYLFGNQVVKSFAAIMIIAEVAIILLVVLITRLLLALICHSNFLDNKPGWFGVKASDIGDINNLEAHTEHHMFEKTNFFVGKKKIAIISSAIVVVGLVVGLVTQFAGNGFFNYNSQMSDGTRIYFQTVDPQFATKEGVIEFISTDTYAGRKPSEIVIGKTTQYISNDDLVEYKDLLEGHGLDTEDVSRNRLNVYNVTLTFDRQLDATSVAAIDSYFEAEELAFYDEDNEIELLETHYTLSSYTPYSGGKTILNALFALAMLGVFAVIYLAIRFSWSYSLSAVAAILHNALILLAILAITRVPFSIEVIAAVLAMVIHTINNIVITFDRLRENVGEASNVVWTKETRTEFMNKALQQTMFGHLFTTVSTIVVVIALVAMCGGSLLPLNITLLVGLLVATYGSYLVLPYCWVYFDTKFAFVKDGLRRRRKPKVKAENGEPEEYIFFGVND